MSFKLFIGNLAYSVTDQDLNDFFASEGNVVSAVVIKDRETDRSKGFGFVEFESDEDGKNAIKNLNDKDLNGRPVSVSEARPREDRRPRDNNRY